MQLLQGRVLLQELDDGVVCWLLPIKNDGYLHYELEGVALRPIFRQYEIHILLLAHFGDQIYQVLLLSLSSFYVLLLANLFQKNWTLLFLSEPAFIFIFFGVILLVDAQRRRSLNRIFLSRLYCFKTVQYCEKGLILFFLVSHFDALGWCLNKLIQTFYLSIIHTAPWNKSFERFHVCRILHNSGPIRVSTSRVHLLIVRGRVVLLVKSVLQNMRIRGQ